MMEQGKTTGDNIGDKINDFVQNNRKSIFIITGAVCILVTATIVFLALSTHMQKKAITAVEELNTKFGELRPFLSEESSTDESREKVKALQEELKTFAVKHKGYAGGRAWSMIGQIHSSNKEWQQSEEAWRNAAKAAEKTYLGPVAYFNAAAAAEEQGKIEDAIALLEKCVASAFAFPAAPRAQFSIGRLHEQLNNKDAAADAYRAVLRNFSNMETWSNLAQSRIIAIEAQ
jgi:tetratricopeptide (TPR) repeat protein